MITPDSITVLNNDDIATIAQIESMIDEGLRSKRGTFGTNMFDRINHDDKPFDDRVWSEIIRRYGAAGWEITIRHTSSGPYIKIEHPDIAMSRITVRS